MPVIHLQIFDLEGGYPTRAHGYPQGPNEWDLMWINILKQCLGLDRIRPAFSENVL